MIVKRLHKAYTVGIVKLITITEEEQMNEAYESILVPVDGSAESEAALDRGIAIALQNGEKTRLHIYM
ncbi:Uncharacterised protein [Weissella viridescens]|uniref:UspA domain-containing protein n=1 Tax=Weissella viridescens TaxID=1629 RepID=A0A380NYD5_WEIVI|nr:Uncharacterised protein [Weissella viridescens]